MSFPVLTAQRFFKFRLSELFDVNSEVVKDYIEQHRSVVELADAIIEDIEYPFYLGAPDDRHDCNYFHGFFCKTIDLDYWQTAAETLTIKKGDCEDSSVAFVTCAVALTTDYKTAYELFGVVKDAATQRILGGHGWSVFLIDEEAGIYAIYESTLDIPPSDYPVVGKFEDVKKPFQLGNIVYEPEWVFNNVEFYSVKPYQITMELGKVVKKENLEKYKRIGKAWKVKTKFEVVYEQKKSKVKRVVKKLLRR